MLENLLGRAVARTPERVVLEFGGRCWTASQLDIEANHITGNLEETGLETMDRVAVLLPNQPELVLIYLACFKAGFVVVPLDYRHQAPQLKYALNHSGASILIADQQRLTELKQEGVVDSVSQVYVVGESAASDRKSVV